jgi:anti-sigma B factor antagonist
MAMSQILSLPDEITIYEAAMVHQTFSAALQSQQPLSVDLSAISEIDAAAVQVLIWAQREGARLGQQVSLIHPSACVLDYLALTGLGTALHFEEASA